MRYEDYSYIDFIEDEFFVRWVKNPDTETSLFWENWLQRHPEKIEEIKIAKGFILNIKYENSFSIKKEDFNIIHENIIHFQKDFQYNHKSNKKALFKRIYWVAAAVLFISVLFTGLLVYFSKPSQPATVEKNVIRYKTTQTQTGSKYTLKLPDGSIAKLNAKSSLQYPESFVNTSKREVYLVGEAFFEVKKNTDKPFVVHTSSFKTEVLGTSFNVKAYNHKNNRVAVVSGLVKVSVDSISELVSPNRMAVLEDQNLKVQNFNMVEEIGWKDGVLYFDDKSLYEVFDELERWYGVDIEVKNPDILTEIYKGEFENESLDNVLSGIGYTSGFNFNISSNKVIIKK